MNGSQIIARLEQEIPLHFAESWDNSGLQVGYRDREVRKVYVALDATEEALEESILWGADLLLTHHPLLMSGIKKVNEEEFHGRKILRMAENHLTHYALHTNFDVCVMGALCSRYLGFRQTEVLEVTGTDSENRPVGIGTVGSLSKPMTVRECCQLVKEAFHLETVRVFGDPEKLVERAALCPGSGKSLVGAALKKQAQIYITGDIGHHDGIDGVDQGLIVVDAGHFGVEQVFVPWMEEFLKNEFPELEILAQKSAGPFQVL